MGRRHHERPDGVDLAEHQTQLGPTADTVDGLGREHGKSTPHGQGAARQQTSFHDVSSISR